MTTNDEDRRRAILLAELQSPRTIEELSDALDVSRMTVYRVLNPLVEQGVVQSTPFRSGRQKKWIASPSAGGSVIHIFSPNGVRPLKDFIGVDWSGVMQDINGVLAQVWRYSAFKGAGGIEGAKAGSMTLPECKARLRWVHEQLTRMVPVVEQMLLADIWDEPTPANAAKFGPVDALLALTKGEEFEARMGR